MINEETLKNWYKAYYAEGGALSFGTANVIRILIETIARDRGYNIKDWK